MKEKQVENVKKIFKDISKTGKDRKWKERKLMNIELAERLENLSYRQFSKVLECAEILRFKKDNEECLKLYQTWFCKNKLCPICNWRRAMKHSYQASKILDKAIEQKPKAKFLFLTLTIKNVEGSELNSTMSFLTKSFDRLFKRTKVQKNLIGYLRATEVSFNQETNLYHPHMHILLMVKSNYFSGSGDNYISQIEWTNMWQQSAKLDYVPIVNIKRVRVKNGKAETDINLKKAIIETAKYPIKPIDMLEISEDKKLKLVDDLMQGLYKKRQIGYGGLLKKIYKELKLDDLENGDLIKVSDEETETTGINLVAVWNWERKNYFIN